MAHHRPSLRFVIVLTLTLLLVTTAGLAIFISFWGSRKATIELTDVLLNQVADSTIARVDNFLQPALSVRELPPKLCTTLPEDLDDIEVIERGLYNHLSAHPQLFRLSFTSADGACYYGLFRREDGTVLTRKTVNHPDGSQTTTCHVRPPDGVFHECQPAEPDLDRYADTSQSWWFIGARWIHEQKQARDVWWDFPDAGKPMLTAACPCVDAQGRFRGVFAAFVWLDDVVDFLATIKVGDTGKVFILDTQRRPIAIGGGGKSLSGLQLRGGERGEDVVYDTGVAEIDALQSVAAISDSYEIGQAYAPRRFDYLAEDIPYIGTVHGMTGDAGSAGWLVGVVIREDEYLGTAKVALRNAILVAIGVLVAATGIGLFIAGRITRPLRGLVVESGRIKELDFSYGGEGQASFREIEQVLGAFENMKSGLRSFEKYVPVKLVRLLLKNRIEPTLGGEVRTVTILFSDIRDFTTISEKLGTNELARALGEYLSIMSQCIGERQGTVDKYIGDAVMAFWGAPLEVEQHALLACESAHACLERVRQAMASRPDFPQFHTRIGIHTADVMVGNFGSPDRLNYTAIGDGVNLAARLEGLNKKYGTSVLVSEDTKNMVHAHFELRKLDVVAVKGKEVPVAIYELLGPRGAVDAARLERARRYETALQAYLTRAWQEALVGFEAMAGEDTAAAMMAERCRVLLMHPPGPDWDGVHRLESK